MSAATPARRDPSCKADMRACRQRPAAIAQSATLLPPTKLHAQPPLLSAGREEGHAGSRPVTSCVQRLIKPVSCR